MEALESKAFVPAKDFDFSKRLCTGLGATVAWSSDDLAYLYVGPSSFLLRRFYRKEHAGDSMAHLLVPDVEAWRRHVEATQIATRYGVRSIPPEDRPWGIRDFVLVDPTGVLWRMGQNIGERERV